MDNLKFLFPQQEGNECILGHTEPRSYIISILVFSTMVFFLIYILYIHILVITKLLLSLV